MYDTLHWKAYQEPKAVDLQGRLYINIIFCTKLQSSWVEPIELARRTVRGTDNNLFTKYAAAVVLIV